MKIYLLAVVCFVLSALIISSCTNPSKIHQRAVNRGYKHTEKIVTVKVTDTIKVNGKDSVIFRDVQAVPAAYAKIERPKQPQIGLQTLKHFKVTFDNQKQLIHFERP